MRIGGLERLAKEVHSLYVSQVEMPRRTSFLALARSIDPARAEIYASRLSGALRAGFTRTAWRSCWRRRTRRWRPRLRRSPEVPMAIAEAGLHAERGRADLLAALWSRIPIWSDEGAVRRELRRGAQHERMRIARHGPGVARRRGHRRHGARVERARRGRMLEVALEEATSAITKCYGAPITEGGAPSCFTILGMGSSAARS